MRKQINIFVYFSSVLLTERRFTIVEVYGVNDAMLIRNSGVDDFARGSVVILAGDNKYRNSPGPMNRIKKTLPSSTRIYYCNTHEFVFYFGHLNKPLRINYKNQ